MILPIDEMTGHAASVEVRDDAKTEQAVATSAISAAIGG